MEPRLRLAHLLRRAGFGPSPGEVEARLVDGYEETVRRLVEPGSEDPELTSLDRQIGTLLDLGNIEDVRTWWTFRMIHSRRPLIEKMAFFWHGHFATSVSKVGKPYLMYRQNQLFREKGLGRFGDLLRGVAQDPAMLVWLDGAGNRKAHPNENFAREVMELFTTGPGVYSETDVQEAARAFTGWHLRDDAFFFNPSEHDGGPKRVLGLEGPLNGDEVLTLLADHPDTAERMTRKLFAFFSYDDPESEAIEPLVAVWKKTKGDVREVLRALFLWPAFSSPRAFRAKVKSPAELVIGSIRALGGTIAPRQVVSLMARMGQDLFNPPSVKGWDGGTAWISTSTLFERMNFAAQATTARGPQGTSHIDPAAVLGNVTPASAREMVDVVVAHLLDGEIPEATHAALLSYLATPDPQRTKTPPDSPRPFALDTLMLDEKLRGLLHLVLSTPEYQLG
ncbi:MAG: DUF1800 domain-containing protein [Thermoanaerobaculia bacterium]